MPIEVRELVVRATVGKKSEESESSTENDEKAKTLKAVNDAVEQVYDALKAKKER